MKFPHFGKFAYNSDQHRMVKQSKRTKRTALAIIAELGSESNAHGLAKIATSIKTKRKVTWALLVIIGFTAATLQLSLLVRKYLDFQVVEVSEMKEGMPVEFPSVTICNTHAQSLSKLKEKILQNKVYEHWFNFLRNANFGKLKTRLESTQAFYENLLEDARAISHDLNDTLLYCRFNQQPCYASNFTKYFDAKNYYNCFTFNSYTNYGKKYMHATGPQNGLSLIIALDNDDPPPGAFGIYNFNDNIAHSAGIRVQVHAPNTMPSPVDHGFDIPPGYSSSVGLKTVLNSRLSNPHGNCTKHMLTGRDTYRNTIFSCLLMCKQRIVEKKCGCKSSGLPDTGSNMSYCGTIHDWKDLYGEMVRKRELNMHSGQKTSLYIKDLECEEENLHHLSNDRSYEANCKCFQPCKETTYQKSLSLSYWPLEFYQYDALTKLYGSKIDQTFMKEAYVYLNDSIKKYEDLYYKSSTEEERKELLQKSMNWTERQKLLRSTELIHQNLLRVNIYFEDLSVVEFKQMPAYELADLFADIGGTLGLWMGISVLTIMELVELLIRLVMLLFNAETKIPDPDDPVTNGMLEHTDMFQHDNYDHYNHPEFKGFEKNDYGRTADTIPSDSPV
ncbi:hypothetical protein FSP39_023507 [Pinctada imbricata]|uniref:FMRFamide-activated amiloride-sensitive sodium channel n=1 Tax=Pinctada imbricata TaxID=66713 RepID=A0AA89C0Y8_PINIB|nr:hypothetical protein FSP39_023507 [Pinctada imbricata]